MTTKMAAAARARELVDIRAELHTIKNQLTQSYIVLHLWEEQAGGEQFRYIDNSADENYCSACKAHTQIRGAQTMPIVHDKDCAAELGRALMKKVKGNP